MNKIDLNEILTPLRFSTFLAIFRALHKYLVHLMQQWHSLTLQKIEMFEVLNLRIFDSKIPEICMVLITFPWKADIFFIKNVNRNLESLVGITTQDTHTWSLLRRRRMPNQNLSHEILSQINLIEIVQD